MVAPSAATRSRIARTSSAGPDRSTRASFGPAAPGVAGPVESPLGHHVIEISSITPARTVPFEDARASLQEELRLELATDLV